MPATIIDKNRQMIKQKGLLDSLPGLVMVYSTRLGGYTYVNNAVKKLLGYEPEDFLDHETDFVSSLIHPEDLATVINQNQAVVMASNRKITDSDLETMTSFEYRLRHADGHWVWLHTQGSVYNHTSLSETGDVLNFSVDITQRKVAEAELLAFSRELEKRVAEHAERLDLAMEASQIGIWEWNIKTGALIWTADMMRIYGLDPKQKDSITYEKFMAALHPADRSMKQALLMKAAETGKPYQVEHRCVWPDGSLHWILGKGKAIMKNGEAYRMVGTAMNIDERKATEKLKTRTVLLKAESKELKALNKTKDEFISLASHQLRTPATTVKQYLGLVTQGFAGDITPTQENLLNKAYAGNERQLYIINEMLHIAKIGAGRIVLARRKNDIGKLIQEVLQEAEAEINSLGHKLTVKLPKKPVFLNIDEHMLRMAIENIISNAIKYTPQGGQINVAMLKTKDSVHIDIQDSGVGIDQKDLSKLYTLFTRLDNQLSQHVSGTGVGLYLAKHLIELHGGKLSVKSIPNKGSTFSIKMPL